MLKSNGIVTSPELVTSVYSKSIKNITEFRKIVNRPLTLSEKVLAGHFLAAYKEDVLVPGDSYVLLQPN